MTRDLYDTVSSVGTIIGELQRSDARNDKANLLRFYKCLSYAEMSYRYSELKMDFSSEVDGETRMYNSDFTDRSEFLRHFILRKCIIVIIIIDGNLLLWIEENQLNVVATSCFQDEIEKLKKIDRSHWSFSRTMTVRTPLLLVFREFLKVKASLYPSAFPQYIRCDSLFP